MFEWLLQHDDGSMRVVNGSYWRSFAAATDATTAVAVAVTVAAASVVFPCLQCHELRLQWLLHRAGSIVRTVRTMHSVSSLLSRAATTAITIAIAVARTRGWRVRGPGPT